MRTPRIRMVGISYFTLVLVNVYYYVAVPSSALQLCVLYIKKLLFSKPLLLDSFSVFPNAPAAHIIWQASCSLYHTTLT